MTDLKSKITRRTFETVGGKRLVVTLHPGDLIGVRTERSRTEFLLTVRKVYQYGALQESEILIDGRRKRSLK